MELPILNFPEKYKFQIKESNSLWYIFDEVRKKWLILTPEEWVRQHTIRFLKKQNQITDSAFVIEKKIELNRQTKRIDILINNKLQPWLLVECKAPEILLTRETFEQAARYNLQIKADFLMLTNGMHHIYFYYDQNHNEYKVIDSLNYRGKI
ncbi:type I restriction enzyme HsdR N-terminal domain-containing protein [Apibacter raozihei]|uniref:type I restriction enzyme HsdR N-terminal domain-containing protein n=1 Tax=Apibacter TaxID=1778601 RepID=UPI000FE34E53|nr:MULTISPECIES: type I restriction enzyme HsdR N-terminal domain-containing protein [Apibacter]